MKKLSINKSIVVLLVVGILVMATAPILATDRVFVIDFVEKEQRSQDGIKWYSHGPQLTHYMILEYEKDYALFSIIPHYSNLKYDNETGLWSRIVVEEYSYIVK